MDSDDQNDTPRQTNPIEPTTPSALNITNEFLVSLSLSFFSLSYHGILFIH
jgi:hypothetical protein